MPDDKDAGNAPPATSDHGEGLARTLAQLEDALEKEPTPPPANEKRRTVR
jgi:hypothetical protein